MLLPPASVADEKRKGKQNKKKFFICEKIFLLFHLLLLLLLCEMKVCGQIYKRTIFVETLQRAKEIHVLPSSWKCFSSETTIIQQIKIRKYSKVHVVVRLPLLFFFFFFLFPPQIKSILNSHYQ
jgi:hypothetical protein